MESTAAGVRGHGACVVSVYKTAAAAAAVAATTRSRCEGTPDTELRSSIARRRRPGRTLCHRGRPNRSFVCRQHLFSSTCPICQRTAEYLRLSGALATTGPAELCAHSHYTLPKSDVYKARTLKANAKAN